MCICCVFSLYLLLFAEHLRDEQQAGRDDDENGRNGGNGRIDLVAQSQKHTARYGRIITARNK